MMISRALLEPLTLVTSSSLPLETHSVSHWCLFYFPGPSSASAPRAEESLVCWWDLAQRRSCWCSQINHEWNFLCRNSGCVTWPSQACNHQPSASRGKKPGGHWKSHCSAQRGAVCLLSEVEWLLGKPCVHVCLCASKINMAKLAALVCLIFGSFFQGQDFQMCSGCCCRERPNLKVVKIPRYIGFQIMFLGSVVASLEYLEEGWSRWNS